MKEIWYFGNVEHNWFFLLKAEKNFSRKKQSFINFVSPIGALIGIFIFDYSFSEERKSLGMGTIFLLIMTIITKFMLQTV